MSSISLNHIYQKIISIAKPSLNVSLAFLAQSMIITTDVMMLGWLGVDEVAASGFVGRLFILGFLMVIGICITTTPLMGSALGGKNRIQGRQIAQQIFWLVFAIGIGAGIAMYYILPLYLSIIEQPIHIQQYALDYGLWLWVSLPFAGIISFQRLYMTVLERTTPFVIVAFGLVVINAVLDYVLIFGFWFVPALGISGASMATLIVTIIHIVALTYCIATLSTYTPHRFFKGIFKLVSIFKPKKLQVRQIIGTGVPISIRMVSESILASVYYIIVASFGTSFTAAYQIATQLETMIGLFAIGTAISINAEIARAKGQKNIREMILSIIAGLCLLACIIIPLSLVLFIFSEPIAILFLPEQDQSTLAVRTILIQMFAIVAIHHCIRIVHMTIMATFDGLGNTKRPASMATMTMWCVGGLGGYILSLTPLQAYGVMIAHILAICVSIIWIGKFLLQQLNTYEKKFIEDEY